jgi:hypothetical protein
MDTSQLTILDTSIAGRAGIDSKSKIQHWQATPKMSNAITAKKQSNLTKHQYGKAKEKMPNGSCGTMLADGKRNL